MVGELVTIVTKSARSDRTRNASDYDKDKNTEKNPLKNNNNTPKNKKRKESNDAYLVADACKIYA
jgi:hypothetical protein